MTRSTMRQNTHGWISANRRRSAARARTPAGFTLFELILAIALGATLLGLLGTAINLYLMRVDADRTRVEEAQLARSVLAMINDDIRGATVYQRQDTAAIAQLMAAGTPFDVDSIDQARQASGGGTGTTGGVGSSGGAGKAGTSLGTSSSSSTSSGNSSGVQQAEELMPLGLNGDPAQLYVDVTKLPRLEELFATMTGYTNAPSATGTNAGGVGASLTGATVNPVADLKTVHYYVRQGDAVEPGSAAATALPAAAQSTAAVTGGLVRQEVPRNERVFSEQNGTTVFSAPEVLIAPEVTQIQFRYFDGTQLLDQWDMKERQQLPLAIEVCIWLRSARAAMAENKDPNDPVNASRPYRQVVYLPMAQASEASAASDVESQMNTLNSGSSTGLDTGGTGSAFGQP